MNDKIQKIKNTFSLLAYAQKHLERSKTNNKQFICPFCNSGTGSNHTSAFTVYNDTNSFYCYSCHTFGDIINLHARLNGMDNNQALADLHSHIGDVQALAPTQTQTVNAYTADDYKKIEKAFSIFNSAIDIEKAPNALTYLLNRGVTNEQIKKYGFKYINNYKFDYFGKTISIYQSICYMVGTQLFIRSIDPNAPKYFQKLKFGKQNELFNQEAIFNHKKIIIVEGAFDCLSVLNCIDNELTTCIALGSTDNKKLFDFTTDKTKDFYLLLDNDEPGIKNAQRLKEQIGSNVQILSFGDWGCKDCNDLFLTNKSKLKSLVDSVLRELQ